MRNIKHRTFGLVVLTAIFMIGGLLGQTPAFADLFFFSTGNPDGLIGTLSRPATGGPIQTETADDFILTQPTSITNATFTGLLPAGTPLSNITNVEIEFYHVFPLDSTTPPSTNVPTRTNSPADVEIGSATREFAAGTLTFTSSLQNPTFTVGNTVINGINKSPNQLTHGEGSASGQEVQVSVLFTTPVVLPADHYFFRPEVDLSSGNFLWLSAPKPMGPPDLQSWIRNDNLAPDWLRIGTDIVGPPPTGGAAPQFNAAFSLTGTTVPVPAGILLLGSGLIGLLGLRRKF